MSEHEHLIRAYVNNQTANRLPDATDLNALLADLDAARDLHDQAMHDYRSVLIERNEARVDLDAARAALVSVQRESDQESARAGKCADDLARVTQERETCKQQAQIHAQEARTANATIAECYRACTGGTGEPGNWHGAEPVRALAARLATCEGLLRQVRHHAPLPRGLEDAIDAILNKEPRT